MRRSASRRKGLKRTVSLTIDSDLYREAKELNVNASRVAEEALANEVERRRAEALAAEIRLDLTAANEYMEKNGSFADLAREHFASDDEAVCDYPRKEPRYCRGIAGRP
jgi:antitoxin CcdA